MAIRCDEPAAESDLAVPAKLALPAVPGVLLVEELGVDVTIRRMLGTTSRDWDLAPSGRAWQAAESDGDANAQWSIVAVVPGTSRARVRLQLLCTETRWDFAPLRLLARAAADSARAEDGGLEAESRNLARAQAVATLSALVVVGRSDAVRRRWPWLAAQALQSRGFAYTRMSRPADARADAVAAAEAWRDIGDRLRSAIARHRAAQQLRREGDLVGAERAFRALRGEAVVRADPTLVGNVTNDLCLTVRHLLRLREAVRCFDDAIALHTAAANPSEAALSRANRANAYERLGRYDEADADVQAALAQARAGGFVRPQLIAELVAGDVARARGRLDAAIRFYLEGLSLAERLQDPLYRANALQQLGIAYLLLRDFARARQFLGEAARAYERGGYWNNAVFALRNLADAERNAELPEQTASTIARALAIVEAGKAGQGAAAELHLLRAEIALTDGASVPLDEAIAAAQSALGDAPSYVQRQRLTIALARRALARDALPAAQAGVQQARRAAQRADDVLGLADLDALQAQISERRGERAAARRHYETAVQRALRVASLQSYPLHRTSYLAQARRSLERLLDLSRADEPAAAVARFGEIAALHLAARRGERALLAATPEQTALLAQVNDRVRERWGIRERESVVEVSAAPGLFARAQQIDARTQAGPRVADAPALLRAWQQQLRDGDALVVSFVGERRVFTWTLRRDGLAEQAAGTAVELRDAAAALLHAVQDRAHGDGATTVAAQAVRTAAGFDGVRVADGARHYLLADGPLAELPPALLLGGSAAAIPAVIRIDDLGAPEAPACCRGLPLQAFADPTVDAASAAARSAASLPRLPGSRLEARTIAANWPDGPAEVWLGTAFTRRRTLAALAREGGIVHFATHGFASRDEPGLSALLVAADDAERGLDVVSFHDLMLADVRARLVVLGACDTASGSSKSGSTGASLAHALLVAGAEHVVAPLWSVDDEIGTAFMRTFYDALANGAEPAAAVAAAQNALAQRSRTAHPYYWAGFAAFEK
ncbi:MAG TPA: CHAT domain-containing tetratricopeptide repeat protein [Tahibacter sp.]|uniref:CHAT domain-containing tetratricopeptide repeat protein n=1 Tax=Tahibacter sp. TaxID=2056211 RepID=UPI002BB49D9E|nr:CHAT domain-containing tetratricopeptide repeat protein [Tahibacter sp.]HSX62696.1 CHAT domain-containing tetratricopeptide repeat protein [Tahibacter sp.]